jgi:acetoacetyl-CoA synthetase
MVTVCMLTLIWERVLQRSPILPDDDFFELGGDLRKALTLLDQIERITGCKLPITSFPMALSVAQMAEVLESPEPKASPLVQIRAGSISVPSVLLANGLGGSALETIPIGKRLRWPGAVYAVQSRGLDELGPPHTRIEDMARVAVDAIVECQPQGPYYLAGFSWGGLVMLEAALRLLEAGAKVALVAFLDTYPHPRLWPMRTWADNGLHQLKMLRQLQMREAVSRLALLPAKILNQLRYYAGEPLRLAPDADGMLPPEFGRLQSAYTLAVACYRPRPFPGTITFLKAEQYGGFPADPAAVWGRLGQRLEVHNIPCEHAEMCTTHAGETADCLSRCLERT